MRARGAKVTDLVVLVVEALRWYSEDDFALRRLVESGRPAIAVVNKVDRARRELRVDSDVKLLEFSGVVRRYDVTRANTVQSELVADARVSYIGHGPTRQATRRRGLAGWLYSAIDWLWPF